MKSIDAADKDESNVDSSSVAEDGENTPKRKKKLDGKKVYFSFVIVNSERQFIVQLPRQ